MEKFKIPCIIFAGGKSSRMGEDKSLLPFRGFNTLTEYQIAKFENYFENIYISTKDKNKFNLKANIIEDNSPLYSPLIGLYSIFTTLKTSSIFVISVDTPFFGVEEFKKLYDKIEENFDALISKESNQIHPMCGIYKNSITQTIEEMMKEKKYKLQLLLNRVKTIYINYQNEKAFLNLNYKSDYEKVKNG